MSGKDLVRLLQQHGWVVDRIKGSHHILVKEGHCLTVPVHRSKDLDRGLEHRILEAWSTAF